MPVCSMRDLPAPLPFIRSADAAEPIAPRRELEMLGGGHPWRGRPNTMMRADRFGTGHRGGHGHRRGPTGLQRGDERFLCHCGIRHPALVASCNASGEWQPRLPMPRLCARGRTLEASRS
jgi:hypothetical protein